MAALEEGAGEARGVEGSDCRFFEKIFPPRKKKIHPTAKVTNHVAAKNAQTLRFFGTQIHIRLAGVDAPELAHFGRPPQPFSQEAIDWLTAYIHGRRVRAYVYKRDQYDRAVATVYVRKWPLLLRRDVGLQMLRRGLATVYEAKTGAEFGRLEERYRSAERWAKRRGRGMWGGRGKEGGFESPREYKVRMGGREGGGK